MRLRLFDGDVTSNQQQEGLIDVSPALLLVSSVPLLALAAISYRYSLHVETSIVIGILRTFVQLSVLGAILAPIFSLQLWWVVLCYVLFMVTVAAAEAAARSKYYFTGLFEMVLAIILAVIGLLGVFAFGVIIRPDPIWSPQYVIPISGMLLGNCINGVSISINGALTNLKEGQLEMEMYQSFGATPTEASARLVREAIRVGAMPTLNSMAIIGLVSIPGMMTGQILGGNPPMHAAKYQMLIMILIATMTFALILGLTGLLRCLAFDHHSQIIITERFLERPKQPTLWRRLQVGCRSLAMYCRALLFCCCRQADERHCSRASSTRTRIEESAPLLVVQFGSDNYYVAPKQNGIQLTTVQQQQERRTNATTADDQQQQPLLQVTNVAKRLDGGRVLFDQLSFVVHAGDILLVSGPSGGGKSQLLKVLAGLSSFENGNITLRDRSYQDYIHAGKAHHWRRKIHYVGQHKVELIGTPRQFIRQVADLHSWRKSRDMARRRRARLSKTSFHSGGWGLLRLLASQWYSSEKQSIPPTPMSEKISAYRLAEHGMPEYNELLESTTYLIEQWGLETSALDTEWKILSGGEAQRIQVALAVASRPRILLLDEATSALDLDSKIRVEGTIQQATAIYGMGVIWITHDEEQMKRLISKNNARAE